MKLTARQVDKVLAELEAKGKDWQQQDLETELKRDLARIMRK